jgi:hypothetical protein
MTETQKKSYEKPQVRELGSIEDLTLAGKILASPSDGFTLAGQPLRTT